MTLKEYEEMYERYGYDGDEPVLGIETLSDTQCPRCGVRVLMVGLRTCYGCYYELVVEELDGNG